MRRLPLLILLLLAVPVPAHAAADRNLWATINVCDTEAKPDTMGIRARMSGTGRRENMYIRFRAHYFVESELRWAPVAGGVSRWIRLGHARVTYREAGYSFRLEPPPAGGRFVVRGQVEYQWRDRRGVRKRARRNTKGGYASTRGADPPGYTAGVCEIR